jgi:hypothetical protein
MWCYQPHDQPVLVILIRPPETSVSKASRHLVAKQVKHGWETWLLNFADEASVHAHRVLYHAVNLQHGTDGFTSPPKEGVLRILPPSIVLGQDWTREPLDHWGRHIIGLWKENDCVGCNIQYILGIVFCESSNAGSIVDETSSRSRRWFARFS